MNENDYKNSLMNDFDVEGVPDWGSYQSQYELELMREVFETLRGIMERRAESFINIDFMDIEIAFRNLHRDKQVKEKFDALVWRSKNIIQSAWIVTEQEDSLLHIAAQYNNDRVVNTLIREGADIHSKRLDGRTPLHCAAAWGHKKIIEILLLAGASRTATDNYGKTPFDLAQDWKRHADILKLFKNSVEGTSIWLKGGEFPAEQNIWKLKTSWKVEFNNSDEKACVKKIIFYRIQAMEHLYIRVYADKNDSKLFSSKTFEPFVERWSDGTFIRLQSTDNALIGYFINQLIIEQPDFESYAIEAADALNVDLDLAYKILPHWVQDRKLFRSTSAQDRILGLDITSKYENENIIHFGVSFRFENDFFSYESTMKDFSGLLIEETTSDAKNKYLGVGINSLDKNASDTFDGILNFLIKICPELSLIKQAIKREFYLNSNGQGKTRSLIRYSHKQPLMERLNCWAGDVPGLREILNDLADRLLLGSKKQEQSNAKICEYIYSTLSKTEKFVDAFAEIYPNFLSIIENVDDFRYFLMHKRYYDNFIHDQSDKYKDEHIALLFEVLPRKFLKDLVYKNGEFDGGEATIESLRNKLLTMMNENRTGLLAHVCLMILAKYWPVNAQDPFNLEEIPEHKRLFVSTGHQFHIDLMKQFNLTRDVRYKLESHTHKKMINPITNIPVFPRDDAHIRHRTGVNITLETLSDCLGYLYLFRNWQQYEKLSNMLKSDEFENALGFGKRIEVKTMRLFDNFPIPWFVEGLATLIRHDVSLEHFMDFSNDKQILLATKPWLLTVIITGMAPEKITHLTVENLIALDKWLCDRNFSQRPTIDEGWPNHYVADKKDLVLIIEKIDQLASSQNNSNLSGGFRRNPSSL